MNKKLREYLILGLLIVITLFLANNVIACQENWLYNQTECNGYNYTIEYYDTNNCGTIVNLSLLNGTIIDCQCIPNWIQDINSCTDGVTLIEYFDYNNCNSTIGLPLNNGTNDYCVVYSQKKYSEDILILIILFALLVISTICAIMIHESFFGLNALFIAFGISIFIIYKYPPILIVASTIMLIIFIVMWIIFGKNSNR